MLQPHPDPRDRDDLPSWVAVAVARPRPAPLGGGKKIFFAALTTRKAPTTTGALPALFVNERVAETVSVWQVTWPRTRNACHHASQVATAVVPPGPFAITDQTDTVSPGFCNVDSHLRLW
jgi:hypothetical protein